MYPEYLYDNTEPEWPSRCSAVLPTLLGASVAASLLSARVVKLVLTRVADRAAKRYFG